MNNPKNNFIVLNEEKNQQFLSRGGGERIYSDVCILQHLNSILMHWTRRNIGIMYKALIPFTHSN